MSADPLMQAFIADRRYERAVDAVRRLASHTIAAGGILSHRAVVEFLLRRPEPLSADDAERCATDGMARWERSRANRMRGRRC